MYPYHSNHSVRLVGSFKNKFILNITNVVEPYIYLAIASYV